MSHWSPPSEQRDQHELQELTREAPAAAAFSRGWYAMALFAGVALVCILGFSTDLFDSGPTNADVSAAYRDGLDRGTIQAEERWAADLEEAWWEQYKIGKAEGSSLAPALIEAVRDGFSWAGGYEAGMQSVDIDVEDEYRQGWMAGYQEGWSAVAGTEPAAPQVPDPPERFRSQAEGSEGPGEP